jgi:hypothetical protein
VPSLNIHTDQEAENPSVAGGSAVDPTKPGPWVTWQETTESPVKGKDQIFVVRPIGPNAENCDNVTPKGENEGGHIPAIGGFCWQQVGLGRVGPGALDPSLNVDPKRNGVEPDIAFTGTNDSVPWVVWYEKDPGTAGLAENEMVFAAKAVKDEAPGAGGFHWVAVGNQLSGTLDTPGKGFGACSESKANEEKCSLNSDPKADAEDPRVAAGTMNPANPTSPWVAWDEIVKGVHQVFVSRLVGAGAAAHFEIVNGGQPISSGGDATRPDITFSGNTPYVSWRQEVGGGVEKGFYGHFVNAESPAFVADESVELTPKAQADVREPISSSCIATPFNEDGKACQGGAIGTPFFLFTNGTSTRRLLADAYEPETPVTGGASAIGASEATVGASVNPHGAAVKVSLQYGTTTAYGQTTAPQSSGVKNEPVALSGQLTGLPAGTTIHYRAVATSDFGTFVGADRTLTTASTSTPPPPPGTTFGVAKPTTAKVTGKAARLTISCTGASASVCHVNARLTVVETLSGRRIVAVSAKRRHKLVVVGSVSLTLNGGQSRTVTVPLNRTGKALLASRHVLKVRLTVTEAGAKGVATLENRVLTFHEHRSTKRRR